MISFLFVSFRASAAECPEAATLTDLRDALDSTRDHLAAGDARGFEEASGALIQRLRCLEDPITPEDAAHVHMNRALVWYRVRMIDPTNLEVAEAHVCAARALLPDYPIEQLVHPDHRFAQLFRDASCPEVSEVTVGNDDLWIDGTPSAAVPGDPAVLPYVLQLVPSAGGVTSTEYVGVGESPAITLLPPPPVPPARHGRPWLGGGVAAAGSMLASVGAGLVVGAVQGPAVYDAVLSYDERVLYRQKLTSQRNAGAALVAVGVAGIGTGAVLAF